MLELRLTVQVWPFPYLFPKEDSGPELRGVN